MKLSRWNRRRLGVALGGALVFLAIHSDSAPAQSQAGSVSAAEAAGVEELVPDLAEEQRLHDEAVANRDRALIERFQTTDGTSVAPRGSVPALRQPLIDLGVDGANQPLPVE
jgi:hypothetical protein